MTKTVVGITKKGIERFESEIKEGNSRMKVKIIKSNNDVVWYKDMIGNIFHVTHCGKSNYRCIFNDDYYIAKEDCEIIDESMEKTIPVELSEDEIKHIYGFQYLFHSVEKKLSQALKKLNEPRPGDRCAFWNDDKNDYIIDVLDKINKNESGSFKRYKPKHINSGGYWFENCAKIEKEAVFKI